MKRVDKEVAQLRAFTVHPGWAWAILAGIKKQEWRTFLPNPREGVCAIHVSKSYTRAQWQREADSVKEWWRRKLPPYEELVENGCPRDRDALIGRDSSTSRASAISFSTSRRTVRRRS